MGDYFFKDQSSKCLEVLGFTKTTNAQRSVLMEGGSFIFKPHKVNQNILNYCLLFLYY